MVEDAKHMIGKRIVILKTMKSYGNQHYRGERGVIQCAYLHKNGKIKSALIMKDGAKMILNTPRVRYQRFWITGRCKVDVL